MGFLHTYFSDNTVKKFALVGLASAVALASGCSSDNPDEGSTLSASAISGVAIDGYLAGASVYLDLNDNGQRNAGEPSAITDKDGYFSNSKDGLTDYCAADASVAEKRHCLTAVLSGNDVMLRSYGGFDVFTGEPFEGALSARVSVQAGSAVTNQIISPLTSMLSHITDDTERQNILTAYGLGESDVSRDFLDMTDFDVDTTKAAIKFHKVVTLLASLLDEHFQAFGDESSFPASSSSLLYKALAEEIAKGAALDSNSITAAYVEVEDQIIALYDADPDVNYPGGISGAAAISDAVKILALVDEAIPPATDFSDVRSRIIGVEMVVKKMLDGDADADVDAAIQSVESVDPPSALYSALADAAAAEYGIDFSALTGINYSQAHDFGSIAVTNAEPLTALADKQLRIDRSEDSNGISGSAHFFFNADTDISGTLHACLKYQDTMEERLEETEGTLINGSWFAIDDNRLILTLEGAFDISLISKGVENMQTKYSLSYGGETLAWLSDNGLVDGLSNSTAAELPVDNAGCIALLTPEV